MNQGVPHRKACGWCQLGVVATVCFGEAFTDWNEYYRLNSGRSVTILHE